ncbi:uncharacterized protein V1510DRAFT_411020 [Dipodascopsis tothii]|uniref:uncharacterized protein n=1 Tax=Dipodascopsis tothii TaxID=44089 RepID=UPI0034CE6CC8
MLTPRGLRLLRTYLTYRAGKMSFEKEQRIGLEAQVKRNPHRDFSAVEAGRPTWDAQDQFHYTQKPGMAWKLGSGATDDEWTKHKKLTIDPYGEGRAAVDNYKLLISGVVPRPIGFVASISADGKHNLAPFSYTTIVNHDPPIFCIGFSGGKGNLKDTCANVLATGELTINIISEWFVEAANATAIDSPAGVNEWQLAGLTPVASEKVKPPHVAESAFSVEAKLVTSHEWTSPSSGRATGTLLIVEGVNFHVREDVVNPELNNIDAAKLKPVSRLGGITYGRTLVGYEMPRPDWAAESAKAEVDELLKKD